MDMIARITSKLISGSFTARTANDLRLAAFTIKTNSIFLYSTTRTQSTSMETVIVREFGLPSVLQFESHAAVPYFTAPMQYRVKLHAIGTNPVETYIRSGNYARLPALPYTPGSDGAGVIEEVGDFSGSDEKPKYAVGDRVYVYGSISGTYANRTICSFDRVFALPQGVSFEEGACLGVPGFTAHRALVTKAKPKANESVLVHGASGGVGLLIVQLSRTLGLRVYGTAGSEEGRRAVVAAGAIECFNHRESGYLEKVKAAVPTGYDICIEMLANSNLGNDLTLMAMHGRVVVVGSRGTVMINPRDIMARELVVTGVMSLAVSREELQQTASDLHLGLANGMLKPLVGLRLPLSKASDAHCEIMKAERAFNGNVVLIPDSIYI